MRFRVASGAMKDLAGKTAVVTGGASGIGRAMVDRFAAEDMNVVVADIDRAAAEATAAELVGAGGRAVGIRTDVSRLDDIRALAEATVDSFGAVHVVCNNAGVVIGGPGRGSHRRRMALGDRRRSVGRDQRHTRVPAAHRGARRRAPGVDLVHVGPGGAAVHRPLLGGQGGRDHVDGGGRTRTRRASVARRSQRAGAGAGRHAPVEQPAQPPGDVDAAVGHARRARRSRRAPRAISQLPGRTRRRSPRSSSRRSVPTGSGSSPTRSGPTSCGVGSTRS